MNSVTPMQAERSLNLGRPDRGGSARPPLAGRPQSEGRGAPGRITESPHGSPGGSSSTNCCPAPPLRQFKPCPHPISTFHEFLPCPPRPLRRLPSAVPNPRATRSILIPIPTRVSICARCSRGSPAACPRSLVSPRWGWRLLPSSIWWPARPRQPRLPCGWPSPSMGPPKASIPITRSSSPGICGRRT